MKTDESISDFRVKTPEEKEEHEVSLPKVLAFSAAGYALVALARFLLAYMSNSIALQADAWHAVADLGAALSALAACFISQMKSKRFPKGLYKIENLVSLVIAGLIFWAGYKIIQEAFFHHDHHHLKNIPFAIAGLAVTVIAVAYLARHKIHAGRETGSPSTIAAGYHSTVAVFASLVVMAGLVGSLFDADVDNIAAGIATAFLAWAGIRIAVNSLKVLLEASLSSRDIRTIREILETSPGVLRILSISGREAGRFKFIEITVALRTRDLEHASYICKKIEKKVKEDVKNADSVDISYIPGGKPRIKQGAPEVPPWRRSVAPVSVELEAQPLPSSLGNDPGKQLKPL